MALSRIGTYKELSVILARVNNSVNIPLADAQQIIGKLKDAKQMELVKVAKIHVSGVRCYPQAPKLPLPGNVCEIFGNETGRFTPERSRDIATPVMLYGSGSSEQQNSINTKLEMTTNIVGDAHVASYDCFGAVSLSSSMQSTVPKPYSSAGKSTHLNMPGGQWSGNGKYIAEFMQKSHYAVLKHDLYLRGNKNVNNFRYGGGGLSIAQRFLNLGSNMAYSTDTSAVKDIKDKSDGTIIKDENLTKAQKLKKAVKDYGSTVIVFHVLFSLMSLGVCYTVVSSGIDITALVKMIPGSSERLESIMTNSSTFLVAYAVHKVFAPMRISITLGATPFIVRYLRRIGILKMPKT